MDLPEVRLIRAQDHTTLGETKFGGAPTLLCGEVNEECCGKPMTFLGQFDSQDFPEAALPDRAIIYVFFCAKCFAFSMAASASDH
jgi:hypothetical protein